MLDWTEYWPMGSDFVNEAAGPNARVSVELCASSARVLLRVVQAALGDEQARRDTAVAAVRLS